MLPSSFGNLFTIHSNYHSNNTRNKNNFRLPLTQTQIGPKIWNDLPRHVKDENLSLYFKKKKKLKQY